jgi:L-rhamnose isomerase
MGFGEASSVKMRRIGNHFSNKVDRSKTNTPGLDFNMTLHPDLDTTHPTQQ